MMDKTIRSMKTLINLGSTPIFKKNKPIKDEKNSRGISDANKELVAKPVWIKLKAIKQRMEIH
jgi:hypothetical protein